MTATAFTLPQPLLTDEAVRLRPWTLDDVPLLVELCGEAEIVKWLPIIPHPYTADHGTQFVERGLRAWRDASSASFAISGAFGGGLLGSIGVGPRTPGVAEVGYWVRREARERGVAARSLVLVSRWVLTQLRVPRLQLRTDVDNLASQRVATKAGFVREGVLRSNGVQRDGTRRDEVMFSLLAADLD